MATEQDELRSFLTNLTDDVARLSFADWLDERYPATPVRLHEIPKGLHRWWHQQKLHQLSIWNHLYGAKYWSNRDVGQALMNWCPFDVRWADHWGASLIAGCPVFVGEPYQRHREMLPVATELQRVLGCPVSYSHSAAWNPGCCRITLWFTFPAPTNKNADGN